VDLRTDREIGRAGEQGTSQANEPAGTLLSFKTGAPPPITTQTTELRNSKSMRFWKTEKDRKQHNTEHYLHHHVVGILQRRRFSSLPIAKKATLAAKYYYYYKAMYRSSGQQQRQRQLHR
jgi:hypothetical protein